MKKIIALLFGCLILMACQRPASITNWSPINDVPTEGALPAEESNSLELTQTVEITPLIVTTSTAETPIVIPIAEVDLSQFPNPLPKSMKGYELVSWQVGETWNYTLITGTNREKTFEELMKPDSQVSEDGFVKITVPGVKQMIQLLGMLPKGSEVMWGGMSLAGQVPNGTIYFSYPPKAIMDEIITFCEENGIKLVNLSEPQ